MQTRQLRCKITEAERTAKAEQLVMVLGEARRLDDERAEQQASARARLKTLEARAAEWAHDHETCSELRAVEVEERHDMRRGQVDTVRLDTDETIESRPMSLSERQTELPLGQAVRQFRDECQRQADEHGTTTSVTMDGETTVVAEPRSSAPAPKAKRSTRGSKT